MTYKERLVAEIKLNEKILRVKEGNVYLPFGSEYSIYLKNLNSKRVSIKISIDGEDVLDGNSLILKPNTSLDLQGFIKDNIALNKFKFIQKTKQIQDHRGDRIDDGLIRIEFAYEKSSNFIEWYNKHCSFDGRGYRYDNNSIHGLINHRGSLHDVLYTSNVYDNTIPTQDEGITVKGTKIQQDFTHTSIGHLENSEVIIFQLKGQTENNNEVQNPITVSSKIQCKTCGINCKSSFSYCPSCGTFLE